MEADIEYAAEYEHEGSTWALNFFAKNVEDATAKIRSIKTGVVLLGEIAGVIAANSSPPTKYPASSK